MIARTIILWRHRWYLYRSDIGAALWLIAFFLAAFVGPSFFVWWRHHG